MSDKTEKWAVIIAILIGIWYVMKKAPTAAAPSNVVPKTSTVGSIVNPIHEVGAATPAQTSVPILYRPAQPATVPVSTRVVASPTSSTYPTSNMLRVYESGTFSRIGMRAPL